jgi:hypothetical protein
VLALLSPIIFKSFNFKHYDIISIEENVGVSKANNILFEATKKEVLLKVEELRCSQISCWDFFLQVWLNVFCWKHLEKQFLFF